MTIAGETVGGSSCGGQLSPGGRTTEMISDGRSDANGKVLIKGVGQHLLPSAGGVEAWAAVRFGSGSRHRKPSFDLLGNLIPGQALVAQLQDLLCGGGMSGRTARTHRDTGALELFPDRAPMNAQLGTDLAQGPTLGIQVGRTVNVHRATITSRTAASGSSGVCGGAPVMPATRSPADGPRPRNDPANTPPRPNP